MFDSVYSFHTTYPANDETKVFEISKSRYNLFKDNAIKIGVPLPLDDVYTTFNSTKHEIFATSYANYHIDSENKLATGIKMVVSKNPNVNIRYAFNDKTHGISNNASNSYGNVTNWSLNEEQLNTFNLLMSNGSYAYKFIAPWTGFNNKVVSASPSGAEYGSMTFDPSFITYIDRTKIFYAVKITFSALQDDKTISNIEIPIDQIIEWSNSNLRIYNYNNQKVFVTNVQIRLYYKNGSNYTSNLVRKNISTGKTDSNIQCWDSFFPFIETYVGDKLIHYNAPLSCLFNNSISGNNVNALYKGNPSSSYDNPFYCDWYETVKHTSANSISSISTLTKSDKELEYLDGIYIGALNDLDLIYKNSDVYDKLGLISLMNDYAISCRRGGEYGFGYYASVTHITSVADIFATFASTLIPFYLVNETSNTPSENLNTFIGKRESNGNTLGLWERYNWQYPQTEKKFRPEDYKPIKPEPVKPTPSDPDRDQIKPPNREGDNIGLNLDNRFGAFNGFLTLYNLTESELGNFGTALMGNPMNYRGNFQKDLSESLSGTYDVSSILNYIVSVKMYPFSVGSLPNTSMQATSSVYIGTGEFGVPIGTECRTLTSSISLINAGSLYVAPLTPYMDFRDYYNTTIVCYLPYCGSVELNPMDIMNTTLQCYYLIDFLTGECTAVLYSIGENNLNYPVAIANGNIGIDIPLSATNSGQLSAIKKMQNAQTAHTIISYINSGLNVVNDAVTLGTSNALNSLFMGGKYYETREKSRAITDIVSSVGSIVDTAFSNSANPYGANRSARSAVATPLMPTGSGATNFMLNDSVYLQIRRGTYSRPNNYGSTIGYPNTFSTRLENVSGLTYCTHVNVSGINCTQEEKYLIKSALEGGTII